jgi:4-amino-4-deoxy-L-arabinose transferase-like glycosyltransferase
MLRTPTQRRSILMKPDFKLTTILLVLTGLLDLVAVPFTLSANHHQSDAVPPVAIVLIAICGVVTLAAAFGVARGVRWAFIVALVCRVLDTFSSALGALNHPTAFLGVNGVILVVLGVAAIVLLVRQFPRRAAVAPRPGTPTHAR